MSDSWCGCGNYQTCPMCRDNPSGDCYKENMRLASQKQQEIKRKLYEIDQEISKLEHLKRLLER